MIVLVGPIAGAFVNKFGCRITGVAGSIIAAVAFILSTFSPSVYIFHFTYGIIGGKLTQKSKPNMYLGSVSLLQGNIMLDHLCETCL